MKENKLGEYFEIPADNISEAFGVNKERAEELDVVVHQGISVAMRNHGKIDDSSLDHLLSDIMRHVDSKLKLEANEKDFCMLHLGIHIPEIADAIRHIRGMRDLKRRMEEDPETTQAQLNLERKLQGSLMRLLATFVDPDEPFERKDNRFSQN
jgi:hypothetical protein